MTTNSTKTIEDKARERISKMNFTAKQENFIFYDWPEGDGHYAWLLTATRAEIISWIEASAC